MIKESDIYRQNADNCMQLAEAEQDERPSSGISEQKLHGLRWLMTRTGLMARDQRLVPMPIKKAEWKLKG